MATWGWLWFWNLSSQTATSDATQVWFWSGMRYGKNLAWNWGKCESKDIGLQLGFFKKNTWTTLEHGMDLIWSGRSKDMPRKKTRKTDQRLGQLYKLKKTWHKLWSLRNENIDDHFGTNQGQDAEKVGGRLPKPKTS